MFDLGRAFLASVDRLPHAIAISDGEKIHAPPFFENVDTASVRKPGFAGQAMTDGLLQDLEAAFWPELFVNHHGSSSSITTVPRKSVPITHEPNAAHEPGSAGKAGLNQVVRMIDLDAHDPDAVASGQVEGENILPVEIKNVLSLHPGAGEVAVAGLPDPLWGQVVTAFIVRREDGTEDELAACRRQSVLAPFKRPRGYIFIR